MEFQPKEIVKKAAIGLSILGLAAAVHSGFPIAVEQRPGAITYKSDGKSEQLTTICLTHPDRNGWNLRLGTCGQDILEVSKRYIPTEIKAMTSRILHRSNRAEIVVPIESYLRETLADKIRS